MTTATQTSPNIVTLSERAIHHVRALLAKENKPGLGLRLGVKGGGCSGLSYVFAWEREPRFGDDVF